MQCWTCQMFGMGWSQESTLWSLRRWQWTVHNTKRREDSQILAEFFWSSDSYEGKKESFFRKFIDDKLSNWTIVSQLKGLVRSAGVVLRCLCPKLTLQFRMTWMTENLHRPHWWGDDYIRWNISDKPCGARRSSLEELLKCFAGYPQKGCGATLCSVLTPSGTHLSVWIVHFRLFRSKLKIKCRNATFAFECLPPSSVNDGTVCPQQGSGT